MKITNEQIAALNTLMLRIVDYEGFTTVPSSCYWNLADAMNDVIQLFDFEDIEIGYCETLNSNPLFTRVVRKAHSFRGGMDSNLIKGYINRF